MNATGLLSMLLAMGRVGTELRSPRRRALRLAVALSLAAATPASAAGPNQPVDVAAKYRLTFNGLDVGKYNFNSHFDGKSYTADSQADISALFGAFKWRGDIETKGAMSGGKPKPGGYVMTFKTKSKKGVVALGFDPSGVTSVKIEPKKPPHPDAVPIGPDDYKGVFDPLSAIFAMTVGASDKPCSKRVPIFDGKARFDLTMSYKGAEKISDKAPSGQPRELVVCRIKYQPIAGHKPKDFTNPWVDYNNIEIAFRPIPSANVLVPYRIAIPTTLGTAQMTAESVTIASPDRPQIALTQ